MFALPLISADHCALTKAKALRIWHLTAFLLLLVGKTNTRINIEIVTIFRFPVSVLSPPRSGTALWLHQALLLHLGATKGSLVTWTVPHLGGISASQTPTAEAVPRAGRVFFPFVLWGRTASEG